MIVHIVFFNLKDTEGYSSEQNTIRLKEGLEALVGTITELHKLEVGLDFNRSEAAYDLSLYTEFTTKAALEAYQVHPAHQEVIALVKEICSGRAVVDYEK